jgi:hypothetical protein
VHGLIIVLVQPVPTMLGVEKMGLTRLDKDARWLGRIYIPDVVFGQGGTRQGSRLTVKWLLARSVGNG